MLAILKQGMIEMYEGYFFIKASEQEKKSR